VDNLCAAQHIVEAAQNQARTKYRSGFIPPAGRMPRSAGNLFLAVSQLTQREKNRARHWQLRKTQVVGRSVAVAGKRGYSGK